MNITLLKILSFREKQAIARGQYADENKHSAKTKKRKTLQRINHWQRFEANCQLGKPSNVFQIMILLKLSLVKQ